MKSYIYFIGGQKDGEVWNGHLLRQGDTVKIPKLLESSSSFSPASTREPVKQEEDTYKCETYGYNGVKSLFLIDETMDRDKAKEQVEKYLTK